MNKFLHPENSQTCCPPGKLPIANHVPHVVVASMMRSGTHMAINLLLNNFPMYRHTPLYVNLDRYIEQGRSVSDLEKAGGSVIKSHFPQAQERIGHEAEFEDFFSNNKIILVTRDSVQIKKSLSNFGLWGRDESSHFEEHEERFYMDGTQIPKTLELEIMTKVGLKRPCCRKHFLTHVDLL
jgi:DNA-directed RNA polymerase subunit N (RpoN/RPB10)